MTHNSYAVMTVKLTEAHGSVRSLSDGKDVRRDLIPPFATVKAWEKKIGKSTGHFLNIRNNEIVKPKSSPNKTSSLTNSPQNKKNPTPGDWDGNYNSKGPPDFFLQFAVL